MNGKVYIASSLSNAARVREIRDKFRSVGITITYDWTTHGFVDTEPKLKKFGENERDGVLECDVFFMIQEGHKGSHCELGIAIARLTFEPFKKRPAIVILQEVEVEPKTFYFLEGINRFTDEQAAFEFSLEQIRRKNECFEQA